MANDAARFPIIINIQINVVDVVDVVEVACLTAINCWLTNSKTRPMCRPY